MNVLQQIFTDYYEEIEYTLHPRASEIENIEKMINCGDPSLGGAMYGYPHCGNLKSVPFRYHSRFCPVCGTPMEQQTPIMKKCPECGNEMYPPVSTAIIVLIRKGKEILLVHARNFRGTFHGLVAGFLETGETLEQCVEREVMEETGLRVKNITYFGSQPWPYPSGLMVGFIADYESGEIKLQADELSSGAFYSKDNLPEIPRKLSIARKLIDWWLENN